MGVGGCGRLQRWWWYPHGSDEGDVCIRQATPGRSRNGDLMARLPQHFFFSPVVPIPYTARQLCMATPRDSDENVWLCICLKWPLLFADKCGFATPPKTLLVTPIMHQRVHSNIEILRLCQKGGGAANRGQIIISPLASTNASLCSVGCGPPRRPGLLFVIGDIAFTAGHSQINHLWLSHRTVRSCWLD